MLLHGIGAKYPSARSVAQEDGLLRPLDGGLPHQAEFSCWGGVGVDFQLLMAAVDGTEEGISDGSRKIPESPVKHKTEVNRISCWCR